MRRRAWELGIDLAQVRPSGTAGRIVQADLDAHVKAHPEERARQAENAGRLKAMLKNACTLARRRRKRLRHIWDIYLQKLSSCYFSSYSISP